MEASATAAARQRGREGTQTEELRIREEKHIISSCRFSNFTLCCNLYHLGQGDLNLFTILYVKFNVSCFSDCSFEACFQTILYTMDVLSGAVRCLSKQETCSYAEP